MVGISMSGSDPCGTSADPYWKPGSSTRAIPRRSRRSGGALGPDELRIERPRLADVVGALDDGAAVGEHRELVAVDGEPEHERVVPDLAERGQSPRHLGEVERLGATRGDLDGIPAA